MSTQHPSSSPHSLPPADALARQLHVFKTLVLLLVLILAAGAGYYLYQRHLGQPETILVDGAPLATVRDASAANYLLKQAQTEAVGTAYAGETPIRLQKILLQRAPADAALDTDSDTIQRLIKALTFRVHGWLILVNDKPSVGLPTQGVAEQTLALVKQHFADLPPDEPIVGDPKILQKIKIVPKVIGLALAKPNAQTAAPYFWTPPPSKTYVVQPGDTGYSIALRNHIPFSDFIAANSSVNLNLLQPGDTVNVQLMPLLLSVQVQKSYTEKQSVLPKGTPGAAGLEQVTYVVTYVDGQQTSENVANVDILQKPATATRL